LRLADYAQRLLSLAETVHRWLGALGALDDKRRRRVAKYAERIAATLARAGEALHRLECAPRDGKAREQAIRELGRITGYIETLVGALDRHLDGRKLAGVKRRLEQLRPGELHKCVVSGRKPMHIEQLASAEGYFRALADGLRT
jgi:uncharacterized membrane protein YccC